MLPALLFWCPWKLRQVHYRGVRPRGSHPTMNDVYVLSSTPDLPGIPELPRSAERLSSVLLPHDGRPVIDVRDRPDRWVDLRRVRECVVRGVPLLGWGSGAALLGRVMGATVVSRDATKSHPNVSLEPHDTLARAIPAGVPLWHERAELPRGAHCLVASGGLPVLFRDGPRVGYAGTDLPAGLVAAFLEWSSVISDRQSASLVERLGGRDRLGAALRHFYGLAREDDLLGPVFAARVTNWEEHLERVTSFWVTMLDGTPEYRGSFVGAHQGLGIAREHVERWLALFEDACTTELGDEGGAELAGRARDMARRIGTKTRRT